jgi:hypothetical protein
LAAEGGHTAKRLPAELPLKLCHMESSLLHIIMLQSQLLFIISGGVLSHKNTRTFPAICAFAAAGHKPVRLMTVLHETKQVSSPQTVVPP